MNLSKSFSERKIIFSPENRVISSLIDFVSQKTKRFCLSKTDIALNEELNKIWLLLKFVIYAISSSFVMTKISIPSSF